LKERRCEKGEKKESWQAEFHLSSLSQFSRGKVSALSQGWPGDKGVTGEGAKGEDKEDLTSISHVPGKREKGKSFIGIGATWR